MRTLKITVLTLLIISANAISVLGQSDIDNKVKNLLNLTVTESNFKEIIEILIESQKKASTNLMSDEYWELFQSLLVDSFKSEGLNKLADFYKEIFTEKEIDEIFNFYSSETGKKMIDSAPRLTEYSLMIGGKMGEDMAVIAFDSIQSTFKQQFNIKRFGCENSKSGTFAYQLNGLEFTVERTAKKQKELTETYTNDLEVTWINDCKYKLKLLSTTDSNTIVEEFPVLIFNIISDNSLGYEYVGKPENNEFYFKGAFIKKN
ncbi:DUF2059 domain-containing protein [Roseivirga sp.]|uniref:DUF2059 domain-containing protein n=1 Tax=Roseivirga sp. TaxID=1964215 RepID=UPI003B8D7BEB